MKKLNIAILLGLTAFSQLSSAQQNYRVYFPISETIPARDNSGGTDPGETDPGEAIPDENYDPEVWRQIEPVYGEWVNITTPNCSYWYPLTSDVAKGAAFNQVSYDCAVEQSRTVQRRILNNNTAEVKNIGAVFKETQSAIVFDSRPSIGTGEEWLPIDPLYSGWAATSEPYGCASWSPSAASVTVASTFTQNSDSCLISQERTKTNQEQERFSLAVRTAGAPITESQVLINQSSTRNYTVKVSDWADNGQYSNCTEWLPLASSQASGVLFTQTQTCTATQARTVNGFIGSTPDAEYKTVTQTQSVPNKTRTQQVMGTMVDKVCKGDASNFMQALNTWNGKVGYTIAWSGVNILYTETATPTTYTKDGYTYTRDYAFYRDSTVSNYVVCRETAK